MASELSMNGRKKIETLQKEFTQKFPYLTLVFLDKERRAIDISKSLSEVRQAKGEDISIIASLKVNTLEKRFLANFGLVVEVAFQKSDKVVYTKDNVDKTLNELNKWCEENGCQPFEFKKSFTGNTLSSVQEQLFEAIKEYYPNAEAKKINKDNYLDIYVPEINKKRGTHLFFNTAKDGIKIGFYCRDEEFVETVISKNSNIEKYAQGIRILDNPIQKNVEEATASALSFIEEITGEEKKDSGVDLKSKLIGDFTETFDLNDFLGYNLTERPGKMSVYEITLEQMEAAIKKNELDIEFEYTDSVDLNDWESLAHIIGKKEAIENKKEYAQDEINESGNINFLYCEGTYVYSVLNPGDAMEDEIDIDNSEDDLDKILKDLGYNGIDDDDENEEEDEADELDEQNFELIKALEIYDDETTAMVQMFSQFGITEVGNGSGSWEGKDYTYNYRTEWNEGYLEEFEAISVESLILLLKTKNINDFTQDDFGSLGLGTLRDGNTTYENFKWASNVNKKDIIDAPDEEELCGDGDKQDSEYEWASPERIEFVVTEDDKEDLNFILINQANSNTNLDDSEDVDISDVEEGITKFSFINNKGEVKFEIECDDIMEFDGEVAIVLKNSNWGLINNTGYLLVDFGEYHYINEFNQGYSKVSKGDDSDLRDGLINIKGELVIECRYIIKSFSEGLVPFANNEQGLWGYMDLTQNIVINNMFDDAEVFCDGLAAVCKNSKWGFIDKKGVMVIDFIYDEARSFCSGLSRVRLNDKIGYINNKGRNITGYIYDNGYNFINNYAIVSKDEENWGMINTSGKEIIICAYDEIQPMSEGLVAAKLGDYWGYLNEMGETVILFKYDSAGCFSEGLASVEIDGKSGYIDRAGKVKIDFLYKVASEFKNGLAKVEYIIDDETIETSSNSSFQKNDNHQFFTVTIGDKEWTTTNLDVDAFRNGEQITQAKTNKEWEKAGEDKKPAWCYYENKIKNGEKYGKLYNWYAVSDSRGLAPLGWEIPSYNDWNQLVEILGGNLWGAGNKLKSDEGWREDENGNNESGFSGLPAGSRRADGDFLDILLSGYWWSCSSECSNDDDDEEFTSVWGAAPQTAWGATLDYSSEFLEIDEIDMGRGYSVRCIKPQ